MATNRDMTSLKRETRVDTFRGSGPGGQHRNKVETAVRVIHLPSGVSATASDHRSQLRNRELAFERLAKKLDRLAHKPKPRKSSKPTMASRRRRMESKRHRGQKKALRGQVGSDDS